MAVNSERCSLGGSSGRCYLRVTDKSIVVNGRLYSTDCYTRISDTLIEADGQLYTMGKFVVHDKFVIVNGRLYTFAGDGACARGAPSPPPCACAHGDAAPLPRPPLSPPAPASQLPSLRSRRSPSPPHSLSHHLPSRPSSDPLRHRHSLSVGDLVSDVPFNTAPAPRAADAVARSAAATAWRGRLANGCSSRQSVSTNSIIESTEKCLEWVERTLGDEGAEQWGSGRAETGLRDGDAASQAPSVTPSESVTAVVEASPVASEPRAGRRPRPPARRSPDAPPATPDAPAAVTPVLLDQQQLRDSFAQMIDDFLAHDDNSRLPPRDRDDLQPPFKRPRLPLVERRK